MTDATLFDSDTDLLARTTDPDTSHAAAQSQQKNLSKLQAIVLQMIQARDFGLSDSQINDLYRRNAEVGVWPKVAWDTPRKRRSDLTRMGLIVDSGDRHSNGNACDEIVWVLA